MTFLQTLESHLYLIPTIISAVQAFQTIGHSKETTLQKVVQIVEVSAAVGEQATVPLVSSISATVESIVEQVFNPQPAPKTA